MHKKLSIAIPTYNRPAFLKDSLKSILNQTFQDFSVYVFDNASDEPVEKVVNEFADPRIYCIGSEKNIGSAGNINRILQYPFDSDYLVIFHDDDAMHPKMLELEITFLDNRKDAVFVVSDLQHVEDATIYQFQDIPENNIPFVLYRNQREFICAVMKWLRYAFDSAMFRTAALKNTRMNFERFSDFADLAFLSEISQKGSCGLLKAPLVNYRMHAQQDSRALKETYENGALEILHLYENVASISRFAPNFLLRTYANINNGFFDFIRFIKKCHQNKVLRYQDFIFLDRRGMISLLSILLRNKRIIEDARWLKNLLPL